MTHLYDSDLHINLFRGACNILFYNFILILVKLLNKKHRNLNNPKQSEAATDVAAAVVVVAVAVAATAVAH